MNAARRRDLIPREFGFPVSPRLFNLGALTGLQGTKTRPELVGQTTPPTPDRRVDALRIGPLQSGQLLPPPNHRYHLGTSLKVMNTS